MKSSTKTYLGVAVGILVLYLLYRRQRAAQQAVAGANAAAAMREASMRAAGS